MQAVEGRSRTLVQAVDGRPGTLMQAVEGRSGTLRSDVIGRPLPPPRVLDPAASEPNATIEEREDLTPTIVRLRVRPDAGVATFRPGQYLALGVVDEGRLLQRPYSTASPCGETIALEFLLRLVEGGEVTPRLWRLDPGARIHLGRPKGRFVPDEGDPRRPVFIATGTGIAPLVSMLESRLREMPDGPARRRPVVVHGVATADELAWADRFAALARQRRIAYVPAISRPRDPVNAGWQGRAGRVDALLPGVMAAEGVDPGDAVAFICGNPGMVDAVSAQLLAHGVPQAAIRTEPYWVRPAQP